MRNILLCGFGMLILAWVLVLSFGQYGNRQIELEDIHGFDPSQYAFQYDPVEFTMPVEDNDWVPVAKRHYNAEDVLEETWLFCSNGDTWTCYTEDGREQKLNSYSRESVLGRDSYIKQDSCDNAGRIAYRLWQNDAHKQMYEEYYYFYEDEKSPAQTSITSHIRKSCSTDLSHDFRKYVDETEVMTSYEIVIFGGDGYGDVLWIESPRYIETNLQGELQTIIQEIPVAYTVYSFDDHGRVSWYAHYTTDGELTDYYVYEYKDV